MNFAFVKGAPIAQIIKTKKGEYIFKFKGKKLLIQKFIEGIEPKKFNKELIKDIAKKQARMNKHFLKIPLDGKYVWKKDFQFKKMEERAGIIGDFDFDEEEEVLLMEIKKLDKSKLRKSVIHGDCHSCNLIVKGNSLKAIIDWDDVHEDFLVQELANFIAHSFICGNTLKKEYLKLYMKMYQKYLKLNSEEKKALYYFIQNRYLGVIAWDEKQKKQHPDQKKQIDKWTREMIRCYRAIKKFGLENFLELVN